MFETSLTKLFQKKEDVNLLKNHWFIHNRSWPSKLMEKCLVKMIEFDVDKSTPPSCWLLSTPWGRAPPWLLKELG